MQAYYDDNVMLGDDEDGQPIYFDWLRDEDVAPVRVQVKEAYVTANWGVAWTDEDTIRRLFNAIKEQHIGTALETNELPGADYRVYTIE
jgi:hypothetical protein